VLQWNPEVATQLIVGSDDDMAPALQLWDLRNSVSPLRELRGHRAGVLGLSWCPQDPAFLISSAKDNRCGCAIRRQACNTLSHRNDNVSHFDQAQSVGSPQQPKRADLYLRMAAPIVLVPHSPAQICVSGCRSHLRAFGERSLVNARRGCLDNWCNLQNAEVGPL